MKLSMSLLGLVLLSGCATAPKPAMTDQMRLGSAANWVILQKCGAQGMISPELTAEGMRIFQIRLAGYTYDAAKLNSEAQMLSTKYPTVESAVCNKAAVDIAGMSKQMERNNKEADAIIAENNRAMSINQPISTYCNKIGSQTFCRTQ